MNDELAGREAARRHAPRGRRFKRHEIELADGGRLVLGIDGSIDHVDAQGSTTHSWTPDDPEWPDQAIRFGLHPQAPAMRVRVAGTGTGTAPCAPCFALVCEPGAQSAPSPLHRRSSLGDLVAAAALEEGNLQLLARAREKGRPISSSQRER